jgi:predicted metal-dependent peptidase
MSAALMMTEPEEPALDMEYLNRELDKTKSAVFLGNNAAFLGSILCNMNFYWSEEIPTACTDGITLYWNPRWFLSLKPGARKTVLVHELWHPARLHMVRQGTRDARIWNYACDIRINNDLTKEGYSFEGIENCWRDPSFDAGAAEEDIYDTLIKNQTPPPQGGSWCPDGVPSDQPGDPSKNQGDMIPGDALTKEQLSQIANNVVRAVHQAKLSKGAGSIPGDLEEILNRFFAPVIPWEEVLHQFMRDLVDETYTWHRPNRRFPNMYLPSRYLDEGKLEHLAYYEDVSGSITDDDAIRFNSEVKYVKEFYQPQKLSLIQFDTRITQIIELEDSDPFDQIKIIGRGGTCLRCVREHIIQTRPTAAIIFSDLECAPMEPLPFDIPIIWVAIRARSTSVPFGKLIHIR